MILDTPTGPISFNRPNFPTPADYVQSCREHFAAGRQPWPWKTADELEAFAEAFPNRAIGLPRPGDLERMGLPRNFGKPVDTFDAEWRQRFFSTLQGDPKFCRAVRLTLEGAI